MSRLQRFGGFCKGSAVVGKAGCCFGLGFFFKIQDLYRHYARTLNLYNDTNKAGHEGAVKKITSISIKSIRCHRSKAGQGVVYKK